MNSQIIYLVVLLTVGFSNGQLPSMFDQFNPIAEKSSEQQVKNDNSTSSENMNASNSINDQNQQQQPSMDDKTGDPTKETNEALKNTMNSIMNVGKAHVNVSKNMADTGMKFANSFPQMGSKLMGQMGNSNGQKKGPMGSFGFF